MDDLGRHVAALIDADELVDLVLEAVSRPSVTLEEKPFSEWIAGELKRDEWDSTELVEVEPGRPNVYASIGGSKGRSLLLAGHLDTVHSDDWVEHWEGSDRENPYGRHVIDGEIWGRGVTDQKAGLCAIVAALRAIRRAGYRPAGQVSALFVCDEESGQPESGISLGMRAAVATVLADPSWQADFAIYTEPTTSAIYTAQIGFLIADIKLTGESAYFGRPDLGVDALKAGHDLLDELWQYSTTLESGKSHDLLGDSFLLVTHVRSGGNIAVPGEFALSLIQKLLPGEDLDSAASRLREIAGGVAEQHGVGVNVEFSAPRDHDVGGTPDEVNRDHPGVQTLADSIELTTGHAARFEGAPYWSEKSFLAALGIPSVYFAPGDIATCHTPFERLSIKEFVLATRTLAHFVASWCGLEQLPTAIEEENK